jgi:hypothetical protein
MKRHFQAGAGRLAHVFLAALLDGRATSPSPWEQAP